MEKPVYLRQTTWDWMKRDFGNLSDSQQKQVAERPGPWLLNLGILNHPELMMNTVIEQNPDDGPGCLIDELAAVALSMGVARVTTFRLGDHKPVIMTREEIETSLREGHIFDQLER